MKQIDNGYINGIKYTVNVNKAGTLVLKWDKGRIKMKVPNWTLDDMPDIMERFKAIIDYDVNDSLFN